MSKHLQQTTGKKHRAENQVRLYTVNHAPRATEEGWIAWFMAVRNQTAVCNDRKLEAPLPQEESTLIQVPHGRRRTSLHGGSQKDKDLCNQEVAPQKDR